MELTVVVIESYEHYKKSLSNSICKQNC